MAYYYAGRHECDFVVKRGRKPVEAIQVCWELSRHNEKREIAGLLEASREFDLPSATILTYAQEEARDVDGCRIHILPVWRWLIPEMR